jgi:hypothetical protein
MRIISPSKGMAAELLQEKALAPTLSQDKPSMGRMDKKQKAGQTMCLPGPKSKKTTIPKG